MAGWERIYLNMFSIGDYMTMKVGLPFAARAFVAKGVAKNVGRNVSVSAFQRIPNIKFCKSCGYMIAKKNNICVCGGGLFLNGDIAEILGGYLILHRKKLLKAYYIKRNKNRNVVNNKNTMNNKRTVVWLLVHSDRLVMWNDTETIDIVYKAFRNDRNVI